MKLGDTIKKITEIAGIPQCDACKNRQAKLNATLDKIFADTLAIINKIK